MSGFSMYWLDDDSVPFATFLGIIQGSYHPDAGPDSFRDLVELVHRGGGGDKMATFKQELAQLLAGDREGLRPDAISVATAYDDWATDDEFLAWLWEELYPGEEPPRKRA